MTDSAQGLMVEGQLLLSDPTAQKAYSFLKAGILKGLSIGYETVKANYVDDVRELAELKLWELSVVMFPMNEGALVTGIKAMSDDERGRHFKAIDAHRKSIDRAQRGIRESLKALFDGFDDEGTTTTSSAIRCSPVATRTRKWACWCWSSRAWPPRPRSSRACKSRHRLTLYRRPARRSRLCEGLHPGTLKTHPGAISCTGERRACSPSKSPISAVDVPGTGIARIQECQRLPPQVHA